MDDGRGAQGVIGPFFCQLKVSKTLQLWIYHFHQLIECGAIARFSLGKQSEKHGVSRLIILQIVF